LNFTALSGSVLLGGLLATAAVLYALQRLRVRHESRTVVTSLFWREATEETRARSLFERFRHPLAYAMALLCAGLMLLGAGRLDEDRDEGLRHVLLLDASAGMARAVGETTRFAQAQAALAAELAESPRDRSEVLWCGEHVRTLLAPGEDRALLGPRLAGRTPDLAPGTLDRALRSRARMEDGEGGGRRFVLFGDAPVAPSTLAALGAGERVERAVLAPVIDGGMGITAMGVSEPASGRWGMVDLFIQTRGGSTSIFDLTLTLDGERFERGGVIGTDGDRRGFLISDVPAAGALLEARLDTDGEAADADLVADDVASIRLPSRPPIRVAVDGLVPAFGAAVRAVLAADPAVELVEGAGEADVVVGGASAGRPSLRFPSSADQEEAILIGHDREVDSSVALASAVGELGLDRVDASALAESLGRPLAVGALPSDVRRVAIWSELMDPSRTSFLESRAFPVLVGRSIRWLAQVPDLTPYRAIGRLEPTALDGARSSLAAMVTVDLDAASLLDPATTAPVTAGVSLAEPSPEGAGPWRLYTWVLLLALAALSAEWALFQRGRMP